VDLLSLLEFGRSSISHQINQSCAFEYATAPLDQNSGTAQHGTARHLWTKTQKKQESLSLCHSNGTQALINNIIPHTKVSSDGKSVLYYHNKAKLLNIT